MTARNLVSTQSSARRSRSAKAGKPADEHAAKLSSGGRPRSEASRIALLETAYRLMKKHPLNAISTQQIAANAGVSTATVYRWWPTKEALLVDAVLHVKKQNVPIGETGSPLERIREHAIASGKFLQGEGGLVAVRLLTAIQDDPKLRQSYSEMFYVPHLSQLMDLARQAVEAGELPRGTNLQVFLDMQFGACLTRMLMRHEQTHPSDFAVAFDIAVAGARSYWAD